MTLAGTPVRFQGLGTPPLDWFGFEMYRGRLEKPVLECYVNAIEPGDTILDIGAFIGVYALVGSIHTGPKGKVFAFEPDPLAREQLERNVALNGVDVQIVPAAVSDREGPLTIETSQLGSSQTRVAAAAGVEVSTVSLDQFCRQHDIQAQVIKMDVEGAEEAIIGDSARQTLSDARVVIVEVHESLGADSDRIHRRFAEWGKVPVALQERWPGQYNVAFVSR